MTDLLGLLSSVNFLGHSLHLTSRIGRGFPNNRQLTQGANAQLDLLPEIILVGDQVQRPFRQVDYRCHGDDTCEEVRMVLQGHGVRDHFGDVTGSGDCVPGMYIERLTGGYGAVWRAGVDAAGRRGVEL